MIEAIVDLHIHSKYARACSKQLELPNIAAACERKGIQVVSTGDFTHPLWFASIERELEEVGESGLFCLKNKASPTRFIIGTEISVVYKHKDKTRRLHLLIFAPSLASAKAFNQALEARGANLRSDGRPIMGIPAKEIVAIAVGIDPRIMVIPAHAWTPWFAVFGSKSGYDSLEACFEEYTPEIFAIETGLSSDPTMNQRLSALDGITLISNSDAHSLDKLAREANVLLFEKESVITYDEIRRILKEKDTNRFAYTIEFYPEEGMYHHDGHRPCKVSLTPEEAKREKLLCPKCKKPLTIGVMHRVEALADRQNSTQAKRIIPHRYIVPLREIIAESFEVGVASKRVAKEYDSLISKLGAEFFILLHASIAEIEKNTPYTKIALGIKNMREGTLSVTPGYDGVYGEVRVLSGGEYHNPVHKELL
jgi:uncharacterized protein (TIGR00375 family)